MLAWRRVCTAKVRALGGALPSMRVAEAAAAGGSSSEGHTSPLAAWARCTLVAELSPSSWCAHCTHSSRRSEPSGARSAAPSTAIASGLSAGCESATHSLMTAVACAAGSDSPFAASACHCSSVMTRSVDGILGSSRTLSNDSSVTLLPPGSGSSPCTHTSGAGSSDICQWSGG